MLDEEYKESLKKKCTITHSTQTQCSQENKARHKRTPTHVKHSQHNEVKFFKNCTPYDSVFYEAQETTNLGCQKSGQWLPSRRKVGFHSCGREG